MFDESETEFENTVKNQAKGFVMPVLGILRQAIGQAVEIAGQHPEAEGVGIVPYVIHANHTDTLHFHGYVFPEFSAYQAKIMDQVAKGPRYMAITFDGYKEEEDQPEKGINSYLVVIFLPNYQEPILYEIEYGLEDGGWRADPERIPYETFEGPFAVVINRHFSQYKKNLT